MKKITKEDWIKAGLKSIAEQGEDSIRIEFLCRELQVSKGSFYHHFQNMEAYILALMMHWQQENTLDIIAATEDEKETDEKIEKLNAIVLEKDHLLEVRLRAWSVRNPKVKEFIERVDQQRMTYLAKLYIEKGILEKKAADLAKIEYAAFVGMQHLFRNLPKQERVNLSELFYQLLNTHSL